MLEKRSIRRGENNYREYSEDAVQRLMGIKAVQAAGFTLAELKELVAVYDSGELTSQKQVGLLRQKIDEIGKKMAELKQIQGNAMAQAEVAAHNMLSSQAERRPYLTIPAFWSLQFGVNIKCVGLSPFADEVVIMQGSVEKRQFVAAYGYQGRTVAAVSFDHGRWLPFYEKQIAAAAPFPPESPSFDIPTTLQPVPARFPRVLI